jgi:hypothetical protein
MTAGNQLTNQENSLIQFPEFITHSGSSAQEMSNSTIQFTKIMLSPFLTLLVKVKMLHFGIYTMK